MIDHCQLNQIQTYGHEIPNNISAFTKINDLPEYLQFIEDTLDSKCDLEIPKLEAHVVGSDGNYRIIKIGIDKNDFHRFMDGDQPVRIIPYYYQGDRKLYVDR